MREMASLELHLAIKELKDKIEGSYLRKFYEDGKGSFRMQFYNNGATTSVYCSLLASFNSTKYSLESQAGTQFAIAMRKRIENAKVKRLYQYGMDRIIIIELSAKGQEYSIVIEMFGRGNLILVKDGAIDLCYKRIIYKDREIRSKAKYQIEQGKADFEEIENDSAELIDAACSEEDMLIRSLSKYFNLGPVYLDDALRSQGVDPKVKAASADRESVGHAMAYAFDRADSPEPVIYIDDSGAYHDYSAYPLEKYGNMRHVSFNSMNELLDEFAKTGRLGTDTETDKKVAEIEASIEKQKLLAKRFADQEKEYAAIGRMILENMNAINALIEEAKLKKKPSVEELNGSSVIKVMGIDLKKKSLTIEL